MIMDDYILFASLLDCIIVFMMMLLKYYIYFDDILVGGVALIKILGVCILEMNCFAKFWSCSLQACNFSNP